MNLTDARTYCGYLLQTQDISLDSETAVLNYCIGDAVDQYSQDKPLVYCEAVAGSGSKRYSLDGLTNFDFEFSVIIEIEYPIDKNPPELIDDRYWTYIQRPSGDNDDLLFIDTTPASGESFHIYYTYYTNDINDVRAKDQRAVVSLAASYACQVMANKANQSGDDNVNADFVDRTSNKNNFVESAKYFEEKYKKRIFGDKDSISPALNITNLDTYVHRQHKRILHKRTYT